MGGSSGSTTQTSSETKREPWAPAQSGLKDLAKSYEGLGQQPFTPQTQQSYLDALTRAEGLAQQPDAAQQAYQQMYGMSQEDMNQGRTHLQGVAGMDPTAGNPQLEAMIQKSRQGALDLANQYGMGAGQVGQGSVTGQGMTVPGMSPQHVQSAFEGMETAALAPRLQDYYTQQGRQDSANQQLWQHGLMSPEYATGVDQSKLQDAQLGLTLGEERNRLADLQNEAELRQLEFQRQGLQGIGMMGGINMGNQFGSSQFRPNPWSVAMGGLGAIMPMFGGGGGLMR